VATTKKTRHTNRERGKKKINPKGTTKDSLWGRGEPEKQL
jgi:hypothetical protein